MLNGLKIKLKKQKVETINNLEKNKKMSRFRIPTPLNVIPNSNDGKVLLDIIKMVDEYPNNYELGKKIREYVNNLKNDQCNIFNERR